ncbi:2-dehydro-3-deoxyphosphogluconate aldolase [Klebsiella michiganensis]|nr:2-dehydro-3-deoxyphosphogluconate aldolase [Klebsiella michiganensis]
MAARFGEQAVIGAGTVLKVEQVDFLADAGAKLIVTPNTEPDDDPPGGGARNAGLRRMRYRDRGVQRAGRRGAVAEDFPVFHLRPGLYSGAESGAAAGVPVLAVAA